MRGAILDGKQGPRMTLAQELEPPPVGWVSPYDSFS